MAFILTYVSRDNFVGMIYLCKQNDTFTMNIEYHPLVPFLPPNARLLMLGSFPPQQKRWCMDFYYPNYQNDMWRILGIVFFKDKNCFVDQKKKTFRKEMIVEFLQEKGIAIFDTATSVRRLQDNASDKFLEIVDETDVKSLLQCIPLCHTVVTTGQKATDVLCDTFLIKQPSLGGFSNFEVNGKLMKLYRMPSSSRAYPLALDKKALFYYKMFKETGF